MESYYCNFNLYRNKRRVSIFGKKMDNNQLQITIIPCSRNDQFSKKKARRIYADILEGKCKADEDCKKDENGNLIDQDCQYKFETVYISFTDKPKRTFMEWAFRNFKSRICIGYKVLFTDGPDEKIVPIYQVVKPQVADHFKRMEAV